MTQSKQSKQAASKSEYGTLTAKLDANNDYASGNAGTSTTASTNSSTSADMNQLSKLANQSQTGSATSSTSSANSKSKMANQTLTAKYDANGDYSAE